MVTGDRFPSIVGLSVRPELTVGTEDSRRHDCSPGEASVSPHSCAIAASYDRSESSLLECANSQHVASSVFRMAPTA